jgi:threonine-phosphate decarboxylase
MKSPVKLAKKEITALRPCVHGSEMMEKVENQNECRGIIDFSTNVNPLGPPSKAVSAIKANFWRIPFYPDTTSERLKIAIARNLNVGADCIIVGNGSIELIWLFAGVFVRKGDEVLIPAPTFGEYEVAVRKSGGRAKFVKLNRRDFQVKANDFLKRMGTRTKAIFLCNPNNPTGGIIAKGELLRIVREAERKDVLVFIDESFMDFVNEGERFTLASSAPAYRHVFVVKSFTKFFALAGVRVGYGVGNEEMVGLLHRARMPWNVNCFAQVAAIAALTDFEYRDKTHQLITEERARMERSLAQIRGFKVYPSNANFILIDTRDTGLTAVQLREKLLKHGVVIRDCSSFKGLDEYFARITIRTRNENELLLRSMQKVLKA